MNHFAPLLAAVDWGLIRLVAIVLFFFVIPAIGRLLVKMRAVQPPGGRPPPPRRVPADVADQIGEFLRRAAERRGVPGGQPVDGPQPAPPAKPQPPPAEQPLRAEVVAEKPVGGQVTEHVEKYLDEQDFSRREDELGREVAQADQQIDQHLRQVFDHRVSKLAAVPGETAAAPTAYEPPDLVGVTADIPDTFATGLLTLITSPDSLSQAIILSEILHRPEERWG